MWWQNVYQSAWTVSLLPSNATKWERVLEAVDADLVARDPVGLIPAARAVYHCPQVWLPYLAAERSVDEFDGAWPLERQQAVVAGSFRYHQVRGTRPALDRALEPLGYSLGVKEWFEFSPPRQANTFTIDLEVDFTMPWTPADRARVVRQANRAKNAHTKLTEIRIKRPTPPAPVFVGGVPTIRRTVISGQQPKITSRLPRHLTFIAVVPRIRRTLLIGPRS